jgi:hypothetical protein
MATHVRREDSSFENLAEVGCLRTATAEIAAEEVVEVVLAEHMDEGDIVEVLEDRLVVVDLSNGSIGVDLREREERKSETASKRNKGIETHHVSVRQARVTDVVTNARNHQSKDVHRTHQFCHSSLLYRPVPPPLPPPLAEVWVVVVLAEEIQRWGETHADEEGVAGLGDIGGVIEVVVAVAGVVGGAE